jgi:signal transduction histidine kinase
LSPQELRETAHDVYKSLGVASDILIDLMTFNKIENGMLQLHKTEIHCRSYIDSCVGSFAAEAREKGVVLTVTILSTIPRQEIAGQSKRRGSGGGMAFGTVACADDREDDEEGRGDSSEAEMGRAIQSSIHFDNSLALLDSDVIKCDKFKMDQVLRNLIRWVTVTVSVAVAV